MVGFVQGDDEGSGSRARFSRGNSKMTEPVNKKIGPDGVKIEVRVHDGKVLQNRGMGGRRSHRKCCDGAGQEEKDGDSGNSSTSGIVRLPSNEKDLEHGQDVGGDTRVSIAETVIRELDTVQNISLQYYRPVTPRTLDEVMFLRGRLW